MAADLGYSPEYNHYFWKRFREEVKKGAGNAGRRTAKVVLEDKANTNLALYLCFLLIA